MDIKKIYTDTTNINIDEQKKIWDERGKGYYGEYMVFRELYQHIYGECKILMNLNIPISNDKTTEIDLLMIHETGIYVFEIKYFKGTIYGKDTDKTWTQYFRTSSNNKFKNPMLQNEYHINAIQNIFPNASIHSVIVFTSDECNLKVENKNLNIDLCTLYDLCRTLETRFNSNAQIYSGEETDLMFNSLIKYSQMKEPVLYDGTVLSFSEWLQPIIEALKENQEKTEEEKNSYTLSIKNLQKSRIKNRIVTAIIAIICIICSLIYSGIVEDEYNERLNIFKQNFMHVDEIGNEYIDKLNDFVTVSNIQLDELSDYAVSFSARLSLSNDIYGILLNESSKYIVITNTGNVYEYDVFGDHLSYNKYNNIIGKGIRNYGDLSKAQFYGVNINNISYIKITNIELFKLDIKRTTIKENLELELYKK
ncbi:MAG: NERD domain-containing protein [Bacilli bacterium]|nr:NERD domain-containing protein [Bacilli bacterium]